MERKRIIGGVLILLAIVIEIFSFTFCKMFYLCEPYCPDNLPTYDWTCIIIASVIAIILLIAGILLIKSKKRER